MNNKFNIIVFILSIASMLCAIGLKLLGVDIFSIPNYSSNYPTIGFIVKLLILLLQYYLIVGCVTCYEPKTLFFKILPFMPLTIILYYTSKEFYVAIAGIILFVTCIALVPKFKTIVSFILNNLFIVFVQLIIIWLRLDIASITPIFPNWLQFAVINIDQIIILTLLYFLNRKRGDLYGLVVSREKK
jgi:hypothetical protein